MLEPWRIVFNDLQQDRSQLMKQLNALTPSQLAIQPSPVAWSILQVADHLVLVERAMIEDAKERLVSPAQVVAPRENIMAFVVLCVLDSGIKIKTPATARSVLPRQDTDLASVNSQWSATRDDLALLLEGLTPERHTSAVFRHPVSGRMTSRQGLKFIRSHMRHHNAQIRRLIQFTS